MDTTVPLCLKKVPRKVIALGNATMRIENVASELIDTLAPEVLFEVPPTKVAFIVKPKYKVRIGAELNRSVLYSKTCLVDTGAGVSIIS